MHQAEHITQQTLDQWLHEAVAHHQQGRLAEALVIYQRILQYAPQHFNALHLLGVLALQQNQYQRAFDLIQNAIAVHPQSREAKRNLALAQKQLGQIKSAIDNLSELLIQDPNDLIARQQRRDLFWETQQFELALKDDEALLQQQAHNPAFLFNHGNLLKKLKHHQQAIQAFRHAIQIKEDLIDARFNLANTLVEMGQLEPALAEYELITQRQPSHAQSYFAKAGVLHDLERLEEALASYDQAIALDDNYADARLNRANLLEDMQRYDEAIESLQHAISTNPQYLQAHSNLGNLYKQIGEMQKALDCYDRALSINPSYGEAHYNIALTMAEQKQFDQALARYDQAIQYAPFFAEAQWNKALLLLLMGDYAKAWSLYEWRWQKEKFTSTKRDFYQPLWLGQQDISRSTILLHAEQGLGDTLQFCRYCDLVAARAGKVILEVQSSLVNLMRTLKGDFTIVAQGDALPEFDYHCPLMSLPLAFNTELNSIPHRDAYLFADAKKSAQWAKHLGKKTRPRIGLVWSGNPKHQSDHERSIPLHTLLQYLPQGLEYVSLHKEIRDSDQAALQQASAGQLKIRLFAKEIKDFSDTAALCAHMDIVISVDTSVAHLAAAMGKTTWILIANSPDWRWLLERDDSPWYQSVRLFRQGIDNQWSPVLERLSEAIRRNCEKV
jgi:tetratricopeptide (TPR) repeat protein